MDKQSEQLMPTPNEDIIQRAMFVVLLREFAQCLLDDDHGISENAYYKLLELANGMGDDWLCTNIQNRALATDGRFYIKG